jgi:septal ring factor EnvC (AmiA/AmiB activator)
VTARLAIVGRALLVCLLVAAGPAAADSAQARQLSALGEQIAQLERSLSRDSSSQQALAEQLAALVRQQNLLAQQRRKVTEQLAASQTELTELEHRESQLVAQIADQRQRASAMLAAHYRLGREPRLKLLLNQQQPAAIQRQLVYYRYLVAARQQLLSALNRDLVALTSVQSERRQRTAGLQQQQASQRQLTTELAASLSRQQSRSRELSAAIQAQRGELAELTEQRQRLERVVAEAAQRAAARQPSQPIGALKGKLPRPAPGRLLHTFGQRRDDQLRWQGWLIDARRGDPIAVVHPGRVVYADYLRGYGLLIIVDHGDEMLSLYAHNSELAANLGDQLNAGQVIGYAGDSGEAVGNALYFELRRSGQPIDPAQWLR